MEVEEMIIFSVGIGIFLKIYIYDSLDSFWKENPSIMEILIVVLKSSNFQRFVVFLFFLFLIILGVLSYVKRVRKANKIDYPYTSNLKENHLELQNYSSETKPIKPLEKDNLEAIESKELKIIEEKSTKKKQRVVNIRVDSNKRFFHKNQLNKDEVEYLLRESFQIKEYKSLLSGKMEDFLLQPRHNESFMHLFMTHNISEFLEKNGIEVELYVTRKPDIVFKIKGEMYAIEIETGSIFSKIERMKDKLKVLEAYDKWFFVVTDRNKVKKYKKYGDAVDKRYVKARLEKLLKYAKKA